MFKNLATIVEVFSDRVLSLIGLRPMYNHHTMVGADRQWSQIFLVPRIVHWSQTSRMNIV